MSDSIGTVGIEVVGLNVPQAVSELNKFADAITKVDTSTKSTVNSVNSSFGQLGSTVTTNTGKLNTEASKVGQTVTKMGTDVQSGTQKVTQSFGQVAQGAGQLNTASTNTQKLGTEISNTGNKFQEFGQKTQQGVQTLGQYSGVANQAGQANNQLASTTGQVVQAETQLVSTTEQATSAQTQLQSSTTQTAQAETELQNAIIGTVQSENELVNATGQAATATDQQTQSTMGAATEVTHLKDSVDQTIPTLQSEVTELENVTRSTDTMTESTEKAATGFERFNEISSGTLNGIGNIAGAAVGLERAIDNLGDAQLAYERKQLRAKNAQDSATVALDKYNAMLKDGVSSQEDIAKALDDANDKMEAARIAGELASDAQHTLNQQWVSFGLQTIPSVVQGVLGGITTFRGLRSTLAETTEATGEASTGFTEMVGTTNTFLATGRNLKLVTEDVSQAVAGQGQVISDTSSIFGEYSTSANDVATVMSGVRDSTTGLSNGINILKGTSGAAGKVMNALADDAVTAGSNIAGAGAAAATAGTKAGGFAAAFKGVAAALGLTAGALVGIIAGVVAAGAAIAAYGTNFMGFRDTVNGVGQSLGEIHPILKVIGDGLVGVAGTLGLTGESAERTKEHFMEMGVGIHQVTEEMKTNWHNALAEMQQSNDVVIVDIANTLINVGTAAETAYGNFRTQIDLTSQTWGEFVTALENKDYSKAVDLIGQSFAAIPGIFETIFEDLDGIIEAAIDGISGTLKDVWNTKIVPWGNEAGKTLGDAFNASIEVIGGLAAEVGKRIFEGLGDMTGQMIQWTKTNIEDPINNFINNIVVSATDIWNTIVGTAGNVYDTVATWIDTNIVKPIQNFPATIGDLTKAVLTGMGIGVTSEDLVNTVSNWLTQIWNEIAKLPEKVVNMGEIIVSKLIDGSYVDIVKSWVGELYDFLNNSWNALWGNKGADQVAFAESDKQGPPKPSTTGQAAPSQITTTTGQTPGTQPTGTAFNLADYEGMSFSDALITFNQTRNERIRKQKEEEERLASTPSLADLSKGSTVPWTGGRGGGVAPSNIMQPTASIDPNLINKAWGGGTRGTGGTGTISTAPTPSVTARTLTPAVKPTETKPEALPTGMVDSGDLEVIVGWENIVKASEAYKALDVAVRATETTMNDYQMILDSTSGRELIARSAVAERQKVMQDLDTSIIKNKASNEEYNRQITEQGLLQKQATLGAQEADKALMDQASSLAKNIGHTERQNELMQTGIPQLIAYGEGQVAVAQAVNKATLEVEKTRGAISQYTAELATGVPQSNAYTQALLDQQMSFLKLQETTAASLGTYTGLIQGMRDATTVQAIQNQAFADGAVSAAQWGVSLLEGQKNQEGFRTGLVEVARSLDVLPASFRGTNEQFQEFISLSAQAGEAYDSFISGIREGGQQIISGLGDAIKKSNADFGDAIDKLEEEAGFKFDNALTNAFESQAGLDAISKTSQQMMEYMDALGSDITPENFEKLRSGFSDGIKETFDDIKDEVGPVGANLVRELLIAIDSPVDLSKPGALEEYFSKIGVVMVKLAGQGSATAQQWVTDMSKINGFTFNEVTGQFEDLNGNIISYDEAVRLAAGGTDALNSSMSATTSQVAQWTEQMNAAAEAGRRYNEVIGGNMYDNTGNAADPSKGQFNWSGDKLGGGPRTDQMPQDGGGGGQGDPTAQMAQSLATIKAEIQTLPVIITEAFTQGIQNAAGQYNLLAEYTTVLVENINANLQPVIEYFTTTFNQATQNAMGTYNLLNEYTTVLVSNIGSTISQVAADFTTHFNTAVNNAMGVYNLLYQYTQTLVANIGTEVAKVHVQFTTSFNNAYQASSAALSSIRGTVATVMGQIGTVIDTVLREAAGKFTALDQVARAAFQNIDTNARVAAYAVGQIGALADQAADAVRALAAELEALPNIERSIIYTYETTNSPPVGAYAGGTFIGATQQNVIVGENGREWVQVTRMEEGGNLGGRRTGSTNEQPFITNGMRYMRLAANERITVVPLEGRNAYLFGKKFPQMKSLQEAMRLEAGITSDGMVISGNTTVKGTTITIGGKIIIDQGFIKDFQNAVNDFSSAVNEQSNVPSGTAGGGNANISNPIIGTGGKSYVPGAGNPACNMGNVGGGGTGGGGGGTGTTGPRTGSTSDTRNINHQTTVNGQQKYYRVQNGQITTNMTDEEIKALNPSYPLPQGGSTGGTGNVGGTPGTGTGGNGGTGNVTPVGNDPNMSNPNNWVIKRWEDGSGYIIVDKTDNKIIARTFQSADEARVYLTAHKEAYANNMYRGPTAGGGQLITSPNAGSTPYTAPSGIVTPHGSAPSSGTGGTGGSGGGTGSTIGGNPSSYYNFTGTPQAGEYRGPTGYVMPTYIKTSGTGQVWQNPNWNPNTWRAVPMTSKGFEGKWKVVDDKGVNIATEFNSESGANEFIQDHRSQYIGPTGNTGGGTGNVGTGGTGNSNTGNVGTGNTPRVPNPGTDRGYPYAKPSHVIEKTEGSSWASANDPERADPKTWQVVQMRDDPSKWKVVTKSGKNIATNFNSKDEALDYVDHYNGRFLTQEQANQGGVTQPSTGGGTGNVTPSTGGTGGTGSTGGGTKDWSHIQTTGGSKWAKTDEERGDPNKGDWTLTPMESDPSKFKIVNKHNRKIIAAGFSSKEEAVDWMNDTQTNTSGGTGWHTSSGVTGSGGTSGTPSTGGGTPGTGNVTPGGGTGTGTGSTSPGTVSGVNYGPITRGENDLDASQWRVVPMRDDPNKYKIEDKNGKTVAYNYSSRQAAEDDMRRYQQTGSFANTNTGGTGGSGNVTPGGGGGTSTGNWSHVQTSGGSKWTTNPVPPYEVVPMNDDPSKFKIIDSTGKNVAAGFTSKQEAEQYLREVLQGGGSTGGGTGTGTPGTGGVGQTPGTGTGNTGGGTGNCTCTGGGGSGGVGTGGGTSGGGTPGTGNVGGGGGGGDSTGGTGGGTGQVGGNVQQSQVISQNSIVNQGNNSNIDLMSGTNSRLQIQNGKIVTATGIFSGWKIGDPIPGMGGGSGLGISKLAQLSELLNRPDWNTFTEAGSDFMGTGVGREIFSDPMIREFGFNTAPYGIARGGTGGTGGTGNTGGGGGGFMGGIFSWFFKIFEEMRKAVESISGKEFNTGAMWRDASNISFRNVGSFL